MSAEPIILSYARPSNGIGEATSDRTVFTFAAPPVTPQVWMTWIVILACIVGSVIFIPLGINAALDDRNDRMFTMVGSMVALAVMAGIILIAFRRRVRLRQFGQADVRFEVRDGALHVRAPQQWGLETRSLALDQIRRVSAHYSEQLMTGVRIFEIHVRRPRRFTTHWSIRVAVHDRGVIDRIVADLNRAIEDGKHAGDCPPCG